MDRNVKNFNTRLRTVKIRELILGIFLAFMFAIGLSIIFPTIESNDDLFMIIWTLSILLFFVWCLKGTNGLNDNIEEIFQKENRNEILYVFIINISFAYIFLFSIVLMDMLLGMGDPTWTSMIDIDSVSLEPTAFLFSAITSIFFAPVIEELIFRGVLFNRMKIRIGIVPAMLLSSLLFAVGHDFGGIMSAFLFGLCMCILYLKTDNILIPMAVHFINNAVATLIDLTPFDSIITSFPWLFLLGIIVLIATILIIRYIIVETRILNQKN